MPEHNPEPLPYGAVPHPRWCTRETCSILRTDVCHRSTPRTVDSTGGQVSVWVESWNRIDDAAAGVPTVVVETGGQGGCGALLAPAAALGLILALTRQVALLTGSPKQWRRLRVRRIGEQLDRISARME
jgi:hypothetical protein